jgi:hypothetical protein
MGSNHRSTALGVPLHDWNHSLSINTRMHIIFMMYYTRKIHTAIHTWVGSADNVKIFFRFQKSYSSYNVESDIKWKSQIDYSFTNCSRLIFWKILTVARHSVLGVEGLEMWTKWWSRSLCTRPTAYLDLHSDSSLKQQPTGRHAAPLGHIIPIPSQLVFALTP